MSSSVTRYISIHALLAESDPGERHASTQQEKFLSTLSLRRATSTLICSAGFGCSFLSTLSLRRATNTEATNHDQVTISIHALLAESDKARIFLNLTFHHFYPRSPCGERPLSKSYLLPSQFISIHALLAESDLDRSAPLASRTNFYPRSPCGERQCDCSFCPSPQVISIHALLAESDLGRGEVV